MDYKPKSRQQKLVEALYPYFGELAATTNQHDHALRVCRHLLALKEDAISSNHAAGFLDVWNSQHPEENYLTNPEFIWALSLLEEHIAGQIRSIEKQLIRSGSPRAKFQVIHGGLSAAPDRQYLEHFLHEYTI